MTLPIRPQVFPGLVGVVMSARRQARLNLSILFAGGAGRIFMDMKSMLTRRQALELGG
jgi:hypothetical protein